MLEMQKPPIIFFYLIGVNFRSLDVRGYANHTSYYDESLRCFSGEVSADTGRLHIVATSALASALLDDHIRE